MSQSESALTEFSINITGDDTLQTLYELADRVFAPTWHHSASRSSPRSTYHRGAVVYYPAAQTGDPAFSPVRIVLLQKWNQLHREVVVDCQTRTIQHNDPETIHLIEPEQIERALEEIKAHVRNEWKSCGVEKPTNWRDFLQRLESNGIPPDKLYADLSSSVHRQCPLCETKTSLCISCRQVMCLNEACDVSRTLPFHSCSQHFSCAMCLPCVKNGTDGWRRLSQCPRCTRWICDSELIWCLGRPTCLSDGPPEHALDEASGTREHPAMPIGCCLCLFGPDRRFCASGRCWSGSFSLATETGMCESCSPEGGLWCACQEYWVCDTCRTGPVDNVLVQCPRCRRAYCHETCNYIGFCAECRRTTLCDDCFEEDRGGLAMDVNAVVLKGEYDSDYECWGAVSKTLCGECLERLTRCRRCRAKTDIAMCSLCSRRPAPDLGGYGRYCMSCIMRFEEEIIEDEFQPEDEDEDESESETE